MFITFVNVYTLYNLLEIENSLDAGMALKRE